MRNQSLTEKLTGTLIGGLTGTVAAFFGSCGAGQYGLMEKTGGIGSSHATDVDSAMDFAFGPGKYIVGAGLAVGLLIDGYRAFSRYREEKAGFKEDFQDWDM